MVINRACGGASASLGTKGGGCLEAMTVMMVLAKSDFEFASVDAFEQKVNWDAAVAAGDIVPLFELYELANNNTDPTYFESGNFKLKTKDGIKGFTYENYIGFCETAALRSYEGSAYKRFFRVTEDGNVIGVFNPATKGVRGQLMKDFSVGVRNEPTSDKPGFVQVDVTMANFRELENNAVIVAPDFNIVGEIPKVNQASILLGALSATSITVSVLHACGGAPVIGALVTDFVVTKADGSDQTISGITESPDGTYALAGTSLVSGSVSLKGVVTIGGEDYQSDVVPFTI